MIALHRARRAGLLALNQVTLLAGILLFPLALATRRTGFARPVGRLVQRVGDAHAHARDDERE